MTLSSWVWVGRRERGSRKPGTVVEIASRIRCPAVTHLLGMGDGRRRGDDRVSVDARCCGGKDTVRSGHLKAGQGRAPYFQTATCVGEEDAHGGAVRHRSVK